MGLIEGGASENLVPPLSGDGFEIFTSDPSNDDSRDYALAYLMKGSQGAKVYYDAFLQGDKGQTVNMYCYVGYSVETQIQNTAQSVVSLLPRVYQVP